MKTLLNLLSAIIVGLLFLTGPVLANNDDNADIFKAFTNCHGCIVGN